MRKLAGMTTTAMKDNKIHEGRNVKRIREMLGIKQDALAFEMDMSQQSVSLLEQKATIEPDILERVAQVLKVPVEAIKNFTEDAAVNYFNTFNDSSGAGAMFSPNNISCSFNPVEKIIELYERMLKEKDELIERLRAEKKN